MKGRTSFASFALMICVCACIKAAHSSNHRESLPVSAKNCSTTLMPQKFLSENMLSGPRKLDLVGIRGISNSIGYSVIDSIKLEQATEGTDEACRVKMASVINLFGKSIPATAAGAQAAVRGTNFQNPVIQSCAGFGLCANIWDGAGQDVYPISTLTYLVVPTIIEDVECKKMKIVYDYIKWVLTDPGASDIALSEGFATMPKKVAELASAQVLDQMKCVNNDMTYRYVKDEPTPTEHLTVQGSGSSLQANLQIQLLRNYPNAGADNTTI